MSPASWHSKEVCLDVTCNKRRSIGNRMSTAYTQHRHWAQPNPIRLPHNNDTYPAYVIKVNYWNEICNNIYTLPQSNGGPRDHGGCVWIVDGNSTSLTFVIDMIWSVVECRSTRNHYFRTFVPRLHNINRYTAWHDPSIRRVHEVSYVTCGAALDANGIFGGRVRVNSPSR